MANKFGEHADAGDFCQKFIRRYGVRAENRKAIAHGVAASTTMAMDITPGHPVVQAYLAYEPTTSDSDIKGLWDTLVRDQVYKAVYRYQPILSRYGMMDQVFRFQDLDAVVDRLEPSA